MKKANLINVKKWVGKIQRIETIKAWDPTDKKGIELAERQLDEISLSEPEKNIIRSGAWYYDEEYGVVESAPAGTSPSYNVE